MLIKPVKLASIWNVSPKSTLHIGAHLGEELTDYESLGWGKIYWIEAQKDLAESLSKRLMDSQHEVIHAAVWDVDNVQLKLNVTNNSQSTSLLQLGTHKSDYPEISVSRVEIVRTVRIDSLFTFSNIPDFINLDIQGAEIQALKSFGDLLQNVKYIYCEVNNKEVYVGCANINEIDEYLRNFGFSRIITKWVPLKGWGDAFYINSKIIKYSRIQKLIGKLVGWNYPLEYLLSSLASRLRKLFR